MNDELVTRVELVWSPLLPGWALWLLAAVALALLTLAWRSSTGVRAGRRRLLIGLRAAALALLGVVLLGPQRVTTEGRPVRDPLVVLLDASRSMQVEDSGGRSRVEEVDAWLQEQEPAFEELRRDYDVRFFTVTDELRPFAVDAPTDGDGSSRAPPPPRRHLAASGGGGRVELAADGTSTDLGQALFGLTEALGGARPAAVLLASDGVDRAALGRALASGGPEAVRRLVGGLPYPVSTWAVGDPKGPADLAVSAVHAPPFGFARRPLTVEADITSDALPEGGSRVLLHADGELVAFEDIDLDEGEARTVSFEVKPDRIGFHTYRISVEPPEGDTIPSNNQLEFTVKVVRDRTRILQVTSRPSWDVKFLRRLLKTDPNIDLVSFFILRTERSRGLSRREELSLIAFPYEELFTQDLQGFDLVIFQNFWFGSFAPFADHYFMQNIAEYVEQGGALLMVGGDFSFGEAGYGSSALAPILPTAVPRDTSRTDRFEVALTPPGQRHPVTRLDRDPIRSAERWRSLPQLQGANPLGPALPGGVVLATAGDGGSPLVAVRSVGRGRTMAFASDTSWRWSMAGTGADSSSQDHAAFWRGAVRWLVQDAEERQVQVITDRENYRLGESIQAQVRVFGDDYSPLVGAEAHVLAWKADREGEPLELTGITDTAGQLGFALPADQEGTMVIQVDVPAIGDHWGTSEARVSVSDRGGELEQPRVRRDLLGAIAEATGGEAWTEAPDPDDLPRKGADALLAVDRRSEPVWANPWLLAALILPLGLEWIWRRRMGLR